MNSSAVDLFYGAKTNEENGEKIHFSKFIYTVTRRYVLITIL